MTDFERVQFGDSFLFLGDAFDILGTLEDGLIDQVISDPPYASQTFGGRCTDCSWDVPIDLTKFWRLVESKTKPSANVVLFGNMRFAYDLINTNLRGFRYDLVWAKNNRTNFLNANLRPLSAHENIMVFGKAGNMAAATYNPVKTSGTRVRVNRVKARKSGGVYPAGEAHTSISDGMTYPISILAVDHDRGNGQGLHPTQKPLNLVGYLIATYSNPGDMILDAFAGSATTGLAAMKLGRRFICIERERSYFDIARQRLTEAYQRRTARRITLLSFPVDASNADPTATAEPIAVNDSTAETTELGDEQTTQEI